MAVVNITKDNFDEEVLKSDKKVLIDFWATWCGPCRMVSPIVDALSDEMTDIKFCKVNVDEQQELAAKHSIMSIPTLIVYENGEKKDEAVGAMNKDALIKFLNK